VVGFSFADQRMKQEAVANFERRLLDIFVSAMGRIAGLESDDLTPAILAEFRSSLSRLQAILEESAPGNFVEQDNLAAEAPRGCRGDVLRPRMSILGRAKYCLGFLLTIDLVNVGDFLDRDPLTVLRHERDFLSRFERSGQRLVDP